jgi:HAD superfamily hydrolase (TIGR01509 family)
MSSGADDGPWVLFDFDGTLVDTLPALRAAYETFLDGYGANGSDAEFERLNGSLLPEIVAHLRAAHRLTVEPGELMCRYLELLDEAAARAVPLPGAAELLETFRPRIGLVTGGRAAEVGRVLDRLGWSFGVVVTGDRVAFGKPSPEPYRLAWREAGEPRRCVVVEDSPNGRRSAEAAGLRVLSVHRDLESGWHARDLAEARRELARWRDGAR